MGGVKEPAVGLDDALFEGSRKLRRIGVEAADEIEALHLIAGQFENFPLENTELDAVDFGELRNEINVTTASGRVGHEVTTVVAGGVAERMTGHAAAVAPVFRCRGNAAGDDIAVEREVEQIGEGGAGFASFDLDDLRRGTHEGIIVAPDGDENVSDLGDDIGAGVASDESLVLRLREHTQRIGFSILPWVCGYV